jgi:hypothetical protein
VTTLHADFEASYQLLPLFARKSTLSASKRKEDTEAAEEARRSEYETNAGPWAFEKGRL